METIYNDKEAEFHRFLCDCLYPGHSLDFYVEKDSDKIVFVEIDITNLGGSSFKWRLKEAIKLILGKDTTAHSIIIREEDYSNLKDILGVVAQLGEPLPCKKDAGGSSPLGSIDIPGKVE